MSYIFLIPLCFFIVFLILHRKKSPSLSKEFNVTEKDIVDCLKSGYTISAIMHYRELHGVSLTEAKEAIQELQKNL